MVKYPQLFLTASTLQAIYADSVHRRQMEACGVLLGQIDEQRNWHAQQILPLQNSASSPVYFEFDPEELLTVELTYPGQIIGVYHSHPTGYPRASITDKQNMYRVNCEQQIPWVWLIVCGPFQAETINPLPPYTTPSTGILLAYHHYAPDAGLQPITIITTA
ncbi:MAG TPA: Mov34/MPN/PAD-1 family protein [Dictyobacter sp.]|nr:Mov34/MPN/PAD-1 family protein [Dictyobacter sp.]